MAKTGMSKAKARRGSSDKVKRQARRMSDVSGVNKAKRLIRYLAANPNDKVARAALEGVSIASASKARREVGEIQPKARKNDPRPVRRRKRAEAQALAA